MGESEHIRRLVYAARRYYLDNRRQSDIAAELGISRPLVSRMLSEARARGIVEIRIHHPDERREGLRDALLRRTGLAGCRLVEDGEDDAATDRALAREAFLLLEELAPRHIGVGWGHFIGRMMDDVEETPRRDSAVETVCPLIGSAGVPVRYYQSNENVRVLADGLGAEPRFLYLPALAEGMEEKRVLCATALYRQMEAEWSAMDAALVNIGNYPSTPDFASGARYGGLLHEERACGRLLAYFYNESGRVIRSSHDFAIQIPLETLGRCACVVGLCAANTSLAAFRGALASRRVTHVVAKASLADAWLRGG